MTKYKVLILTDHTNHSAENSLYAYVRTMSQHPMCRLAAVATRKEAHNNSFFNLEQAATIHGVVADRSFAYDKDGSSFTNNLQAFQLDTFDLIWLRLPPPLSKSFLDFLTNQLSNAFIVNRPSSIYETGSKGFLVNFPEICPPMKICHSVEDIIAFKQHHPIVLKPFREYGGKGIVRIDRDKVWEGKREMSFDVFKARLDQQNIEYLAVPFLKNVSMGDKRIIVVNGKIMGASLRLPAQDSWLCNISMGGTSTYAEADEDEKEIVQQLNPVLSKMGIVMYGVDTLVNDDGKRILSEINTTSIGGLPQIAKLTKQPLVAEAIDLIWQYFLANKKQ